MESIPPSSVRADSPALIGTLDAIASATGDIAVPFRPGESLCTGLGRAVLRPVLAAAVRDHVKGAVAASARHALGADRIVGRDTLRQTLAHALDTAVTPEIADEYANIVAGEHRLRGPSRAPLDSSDAATHLLSPRMRDAAFFACSHELDRAERSHLVRYELTDRHRPDRMTWVRSMRRERTNVFREANAEWQAFIKAGFEARALHADFLGRFDDFTPQARAVAYLESARRPEGYVKESLKHALRLATHPQTQAEAHLQLGLLGGEDDDAIKNLKQAISLSTDPRTQATANFRLGDIYDLDDEDKREHFEEALRLAVDPHMQASAHLQLGYLRDDDAREHFEQAIRLAADPQMQAEAHFQLGYLRDDDAREHFEQTIRLATNPHMQAEAHLELGQLEEEDAREHFEHAIRLATNPEARYSAHLRLGELGGDDAREHFEHALRATTCSCQRAVTHLRLGELGGDDAQQHLVEAVRLEAYSRRRIFDPEAHLERGKLGDDAAREYFRKALPEMLNPDLQAAVRRKLEELDEGDTTALPHDA